MGRLYQVIAGSAVTTYAYYDNGNRQLLTYPNGLTAEYTYYADNSLYCFRLETENKFEK